MYGQAIGDRVKMALLCDYALTAQDGKLSVLGVFSNISFPSLPAAYPRFFVVTILVLDPGQHMAHVQVVAPHGMDMLVQGPEMALDVPLPASETNLMIGFDNLHFEMPGLYQVRIHVDGLVAVIIPFAVMLGSADGLAEGAQA